ncbi:MAG: hypothetical protein EON98_09540 [Chitinophagaceae bacterium]|nr:MAG: hypothetical protein EON98_09540 [Chitinophagaceae bacterium]
MKALNRLLCNEPALYEDQFNQQGFEWGDLNHRNDCVVVYKRKGKTKGDDVLVLLNLNPVPKENWEVVVDRKYKEEIFNSDDIAFWGTGDYLNETIKCELLVSDEKNNLENTNKKNYKLTVKLPPLAGIVLK